ncbi:MAG TPA: hypothetical protein VMB74_11890 [Streptosporangiaceae bacterium]|nr:hypothetical protein [Streptosporangiaceae bacterium]
MSGEPFVAHRSLLFTVAYEMRGPWLPEPLLTGPDVAGDIELAESLSMAMLLVLETPPTCRRLPG